MSGIALIVARSLRTHALSTFVTIIAAGLASGLVMSVFTVSQQSRDAFAGGDIGYDAVLGAKGSQLQLVLNTVYHLESSPGNIPWSKYKAVQKARGVKYAIPYAVGDNFFGHRIVGTTEQIFDEFEFQAGRKYTFAEGRKFDEGHMEAVIGSTVASKFGLEVGDDFNPSHGFVYRAGAEHTERYVIVGILEPTNTPADQVLWIPIEGIYRMSGHELADGTESETIGSNDIPDELKEVSAVMIKFHRPAHGMQLANDINAGDEMTMAYPIANVMLSFLSKLGWITVILKYIAYLVVVVAGFGLLASIYNTMNERRREFAILRALGAKKRTVFTAIVAEAVTIAFLGSILGYALYLGVMALTREIIQNRTGVVLDVLVYHPALVWTPLGMMLVGALAGVFPALKAYSTDVARTLS